MRSSNFIYSSFFLASSSLIRLSLSKYLPSTSLTRSGFTVSSNSLKAFCFSSSVFLILSPIELILLSKLSSPYIASSLSFLIECCVFLIILLLSLILYLVSLAAIIVSLCASIRLIYTLLPIIRSNIPITPAYITGTYAGMTGNKYNAAGINANTMSRNKVYTNTSLTFLEIYNAIKNELLTIRGIFS